MIENSGRIVGIIAHVDAGKTTLSEALLYYAGNIRSVGRVDHGDAFLDTDAMEKERGITIFSKQARLTLGERAFTLLDTPGHGDLTPEMERTLGVLDACILVISASDGIGGHVRMLWRMLEQYQIPVFVFVNKMDQPGADKKALLQSVKAGLSANAVDFSEGTEGREIQEEIAVCDDALLEGFLEGIPAGKEQVRELVAKRSLFPVYFGSALHMTGVDCLAEGLREYLGHGSFPDEFGARVYKVTHEDGVRLSWMKVTGGCLKVRDTLVTGTESEDGEASPVIEKVSRLRVYSGSRYTAVQEVPAGDICAVEGLNRVQAGQSLGAGPAGMGTLMQPVEVRAVIILDGTDTTTALRYLKELEEEDPSLQVSYNEHAGEIQVRIMGRIQAEILQRLISERYGMQVDFGPGSVVYRETISKAVEGVGHYEPLRHYSEVHLMLEPGKPGSGLVFEDQCTPDTLEGNFRRLIVKHLAEKTHRGVLTGSPITDMKISLTGGLSHPKHTEGGDFRQSTYRAVRQGLMMAKSLGAAVLLEPMMEVRVDIPRESLGRALNDLQQMNGRLEPPVLTEESAVISGIIPAACIGDYASELASYTHGEGSVFMALYGYEPCHNTDEILKQKAYSPDEDLDEPASSIFCSHGAAVLVPWDEVREHMHLDNGWRPEEARSPRDEENDAGSGEERKSKGRTVRSRDFFAGEDELIAIFERTYGPIKNRLAMRPAERMRSGNASHDTGNPGEPGQQGAVSGSRRVKNRVSEKSYLLVDGYNIIYAWEDLKELAADDIGAARDRLLDIMSNYAGFSDENVIVVFDAYRVSGGRGEVFRYNNIDVVYTKEAETADLYIEKTSHELVKKYRVTVATSDAIEQVIIFGGGALRLSARGLLEQIIAAEDEMREKYLK